MKEELVVSFFSTADAMRAEELYRAAAVPGRLIPLPPDSHADCGLAWRLPIEKRPELDRALEGKLKPAGFLRHSFRW